MDNRALPIRLHSDISANKLASVGVESRLVAVERNGLKVGKAVNLHTNLTNGYTAFFFWVATKHITCWFRDVGHGKTFLRRSPAPAKDNQMRGLSSEND